MLKHRGFSLLFTVLLVALAGFVAVWLAFPWLLSARQEKIEVALARGVAPGANGIPSNAAARERALIVEFAEAHGGFKALVGTEHYRALSAPCRKLVDDYVSVLDKPADTSADAAADRARVADIERGFAASCVDDAPTTSAATLAAGPTPNTPAVMKGLGANLEAYRALTPECRGYVDTFMGLFDQPGTTPTDRDRLAEADRLFSANCVDREAKARALAETQARQAEEGRQLACGQKREQATQLRALVDLTLGEEPPTPGTIDEDKRQRRESLEENQRRLDELDADILGNCQ